MHDQTPSARIAGGAAIDLALRFIRAIEAGHDPTDLVTSDAIEEELPNRYFEHGATRDRAAMQAGVERGKAIFRRQAYVVRRAVGDDQVAALELAWTGELAIQVRALPPGSTMQAQCAFFFEVRDGRIARIRHYDSFTPF